MKALPDVLADKWDDEDFQSYRKSFPEEVQNDPDLLQAHVEDLTKRDVKVAYLKNLQGFLWENGYKTGVYSTPLFLDVTPRLKQWKEDGLELAIYSSGSVFAQKLLFEHVKSEQPVAGQKRQRSDEDEEGDADGAERPVKKRATVTESDGVEDSSASDAIAATLKETKVPPDEANGSQSRTTAESVPGTEDLQYLISGWYDTTNAGLKAEVGSYERIAADLKISTNDILFLSDNVKEVDAAGAAGMHSLMVERPGNAPLSDSDRDRLTIIESLEAVDLSQYDGSRNSKAVDGAEPESIVAAGADEVEK